MMKFNLLKVASVVAAIALGSGAFATDALARGGGGGFAGGHMGGGFGGGHFGGGGHIGGGLGGGHFDGGHFGHARHFFGGGLGAPYYGYDNGCWPPDDYRQRWSYDCD